MTRDPRMVERKKPGQKKSKEKNTIFKKIIITMAIDVKKLLDAGVHFGHLTRKGIQIWFHIFLWRRMELIY